MGINPVAKSLTSGISGLVVRSSGDLGPIPPAMDPVGESWWNTFRISLAAIFRFLPSPPLIRLPTA